MPVKESSFILRPAVFFDRDGTLMEEAHYCADPAQVRVFPGTAAALRRLKERGYLCVIITNQSGIGRGLFTEAQFHAVQAEVLRQLRRQEEENLELRNSGKGAGNTGEVGEVQLGNEAEEEEDKAEVLRGDLIAATYFCPDAPDIPSSRRKPEPGMVLEAARDLRLDLARSWFVGDKSADIGCGKNAGTRTLLVQTGYGAKEAESLGNRGVFPDFIAKDVVAAVEIILTN